MDARMALSRVFPELAGLLKSQGGGCRGCSDSSVARAILTYMATYGRGRDLSQLAGVLPAEFIKAVQDGES